MKLTIDMDCDNDAFQAIDILLIDEIKQVINNSLMRLYFELQSSKDNVIFIGMYDSNGNDVGTLRFIVRE